jgi:MFS family permease
LETAAQIQSSPTLSRKLRVFIPFALGYFLSYLFRVVNAVIAPDLTADLSLDPSQLGMLTAAYFISFAACQLPLGILLDRFGPRRIESVLLLFAGAGALFFAGSESLPGIVFGRVLIGFGVSSCLMAAFKAYVLWFPKEQWPKINGFQMAAGGLGALTATAPVEAMLSVTDWRGVFSILAVLTLAVSASVFFVVPEKEREPEARMPETHLGDPLRGIVQVFSSLAFWRVAPLTAASQSAFLSVQGLWSGPWLRDVALLNRSEIAGVLLLIAAAMVAGFILLGTLAGHLNRKGIDPTKTAVIGMALFMCLQLAMILEIRSLTVPLWILYGFFGTTGIISYAGLSQQFPQHLTGRLTTGLNLLVFVSAFAVQWAIGAIIDLWPVGENGNYAPAGYRAGFALMLGFQIISLVWFFLAGKIGRSANESFPHTDRSPQNP